jgi:hypothetical protein
VARAEGVLHRRAALSPEECERWTRAVYAARADWTPCFEGVQFTLGRAWYTHLEEGRADEYFREAPVSDARVERALPGLKARFGALMSELVAAPVYRRAGWCGPGVHVFPAGAWLSRHGGDVHFDTEGLLPDELEGRAPAVSVVLMLQAPARGGGLRVWNARYTGDDEVDEPERGASLLVDYAAGDLVAIDSYRLHQIQPFEGTRDRISVTAHLVRRHGRWSAWF